MIKDTILSTKEDVEYIDLQVILPKIFMSCRIMWRIKPINFDMLRLKKITISRRLLGNWITSFLRLVSASAIEKETRKEAMLRRPVAISNDSNRFDDRFRTCACQHRSIESLADWEHENNSLANEEEALRSFKRARSK